MTKLYKICQTAIKTALNCLDRADISGYFQHLKAAVPAQHLTRYNALQQEFVSGRSPWNFDQQLRTFADMLAESDGATNAPSGAAPVAPAAPVPPVVPITSREPVSPAAATTIEPSTITPPTPPSTTWEKIVQFLRDIPVIIKGIGALAAAVLAIVPFLKSPDPGEPQKVTLQGELLSAANGQPVDNVQIWIKDHRDLNANLRTGENTFAIKPVDPKMDNGLVALVVDYKDPVYSEELVSSTLINLNNYKVEGGIVNIGEVFIPEPAKIKPTTPQVPSSGTKGKKASPIVLTGYLDLGYPGKNLRDVRRVFLTDSPTNDDKNVATGAFKIPLEKPFSDGLYKISVEFFDGTITPPVLQKQLQAPGANGELPLGTLTFRR